MHRHPKVIVVFDEDIKLQAYQDSFFSWQKANGFLLDIIDEIQLRT